MALYLVTGGAGFIGSHIVHALLARGDRVRVLDDLSGGRMHNLEGREVGQAGSGAPVEFLQGSVDDAEAARNACEGVQGVFHHAALVSVPRSVEDPGLSFRINVQGTFELLRAAAAGGAERFVLASSSAIYGEDETVPKVESMAPDPVSPYAGDKLTGETMLQVWGRSFGLGTVALRYFNVYGPRQADDSPYSGVIALFARAALEGRQVKIFGDGLQTRDFVFVEDVVQANLLAMDARDLAPGARFNVGTGEAVTIRDLYDEIADIAGSGVEPLHEEGRKGDVRHSRADITAIHSSLGFTPRVARREGLERTVRWYGERGG